MIKTNILQRNRIPAYQKSLHHQLQIKAEEKNIEII